MSMHTFELPGLRDLAALGKLLKTEAPQEDNLVIDTAKLKERKNQIGRFNSEKNGAHFYQLITYW